MKKEDINLRIFNTYGKMVYSDAIMFFLLGWILIQTFLIQPFTIVSIISIIFGDFFILGGASSITQKGKEHSQIIKCERFEVIQEKIAYEEKERQVIPLDILARDPRIKDLSNKNGK